MKLVADASAYGVANVISHRMPHGTGRSIAFASRALSSSERSYTHSEKEVLFKVYGVKKFHRYVYGQKFTLLTDHQCLTPIFNPKKGLAAPQLQHWALLLSAWDYNIILSTPENTTKSIGYQD